LSRCPIRLGDTAATSAPEFEAIDAEAVTQGGAVRPDQGVGVMSCIDTLTEPKDRGRLWTCTESESGARGMRDCKA